MALTREELLDLMWEVVDGFNTQSDIFNNLHPQEIETNRERAKQGIYESNRRVLDMLFQTGAISQATLAFATKDNIIWQHQGEVAKTGNSAPIPARVENGEPLISPDAPRPPIHVPGTRPSADNNYAPPPPPAENEGKPNPYAHLPQTVEEAYKLAAEQQAAKQANKEPVASKKEQPANPGQFNQQELKEINGVDAIPTIPPRGPSQPPREQMGMQIGVPQPMAQPMQPPMPPQVGQPPIRHDMPGSPLPQTPRSAPNHVGEIPLPKPDLPKDGPQPIRDPWQQPNPLLMPNNNE